MENDEEGKNYDTRNICKAYGWAIYSGWVAPLASRMHCLTMSPQRRLSTVYTPYAATTANLCYSGLSDAVSGLFLITFASINSFWSSIAVVKMMPAPSVSRLRAGRTFYRPHLLAFLDFYFFYYSQRLRTCYEKTRYFRDPRRAPLTNLYPLLYPSFFEFLLSADVNCYGGSLFFIDAGACAKEWSEWGVVLPGGWSDSGHITFQ